MPLRKIHGVGSVVPNEYCYKTYPRLYNIWQHMLGRCYSPNSLRHKPSYRHITVCYQWFEFKGFVVWALSNGYFDNAELDKDLKGGNQYSPETCTFVTKKENLAEVGKRRAKPFKLVHLETGEVFTSELSRNAFEKKHGMYKGAIAALMNGKCKTSCGFKAFTEEKE